MAVQMTEVELADAPWVRPWAAWSLRGRVQQLACASRRRRRGCRGTTPFRLGLLRDSDSLAAADLDAQPICRRCQRARPPIVVRTGGVVGVVEVEHEPVALHPEVGAFDGVEEVAAGPVRLAA